MTRKLLPYEYNLIEALGVSKKDYLDFVAQQHIPQVDSVFPEETEQSFRLHEAH